MKGRRTPWHSFDGLTEAKKREKARIGLIMAIVFFALMNVIVFLT